jgi:ERCC4-type nuclease
MMFVDDRKGSGEFERPLKRQGIPVTVHRMESADFRWWGNGPNGRVRVGVERKTVSEIVGCIGDNRFTGEQLPRMLRKYWPYAYLIVEGSAYPGKDGILMQGRRAAGFTRQYHLYENYEKFLMTVELKGGMRVKRTANPAQTAALLASMYRWFIDKKWSEHKSVYTVDETKPERAIFDERTLTRKILAQLPGVGWDRSGKVETYFQGQSLDAIFSATVDDWQAALGVKDGLKIARRLHMVCTTPGSVVDGKGR